jgi:succinate dehydrogenase / fumarate reductase cytochrome b subunit
MNSLRDFWHSSIGKKTVMAITGLIGVAYVLMHMVGNLQVFQGAERINAYGHLLHGPLNEVLWLARVVLIAALVLHVVAAYQLTMRDRAARPAGYADRRPQVSTLASRTIRIGGVLLLLFIPFHILHYTTGTIRPAGRFVAGDVYANVVAGFHVWWVTTFYVLAMVALAYHLYHGTWSSARSLGVAPPTLHPLRRTLPLILAVVIAGGFVAVPLAVAFGLVR